MNTYLSFVVDTSTSWLATMPRLPDATVQSMSVPEIMFRVSDDSRLLVVARNREIPTITFPWDVLRHQGTGTRQTWIPSSLQHDDSTTSLASATHRVVNDHVVCRYCGALG
jgi:hypothetical protein